MLKSFNGLTQQVFEKPFRGMLYGVYNFAEDEYYTHRLKNMGYDTDIDSLEFMSLDIDGNINELIPFKQYIENEIQGDKKVMEVLLYKGKKGILPIVIKPKSVNVEDILKEKTNG